MAPGIVETGRLAVQDDHPDGGSHKIGGNSIKPVTNDGDWNLRKQSTGWEPQSEDDFAVLAVRNTVLDMTQQNGGGHGGSALGMAAIGIALWKHVMRYNPCDPDWFDRDRFVLSNGMDICAILLRKSTS